MMVTSSAGSEFLSGWVLASSFTLIPMKADMDLVTHVDHGIHTLHSLLSHPLLSPNIWEPPGGCADLVAMIRLTKETHGSSFSLLWNPLRNTFFLLIKINNQIAVIKTGIGFPIFKISLTITILKILCGK
jgi:hypothetical protein